MRTIKSANAPPKKNLYAMHIKEANLLPFFPPTARQQGMNTCFDADRLDLPRVGITPDPDKMATKEGAEKARA